MIQAALESLLEIVPVKLLRLVSLVLFGAAAAILFNHETRLRAGEIRDIENRAKADAQIDAIHELTAEVRGYRQALIPEAKRIEDAKRSKK